MNAQLLAHSGFYNPDGRGEYAGCPLKYSNYGGLHFISYSTTIARVVNDRNGNPVTLVSDYNYTHTTAKHLSYIMGASPYPVVFVPNCEIADMVYIFRNKLEPYQKVEMDDDRYYQNGYKPEDFLQAKERATLFNLLHMFDNYQERVGGLDELLPLRTMGMVACWERLCLAIDNKTMSRKEAIAQAKDGFNVALNEQLAIAKERERQRKLKEAAEKRKRTIRTKKALAAIQAYNAKKAINSVLLYNILYPWRLDASPEVLKQLNEMHEQLKAVMFETQTGTRYASYVYVDREHDRIDTSKNCPVSIPTVKRLLTMWKNKQNIIGEQCEAYRVVANNKDYVQVGCHVIPLWNVQMLYNELIAA